MGFLFQKNYHFIQKYTQTQLREKEICKLLSVWKISKANKTEKLKQKDLPICLGERMYA